MQSSAQSLCMGCLNAMQHQSCHWQSCCVPLPHDVLVPAVPLCRGQHYYTICPCLKQACRSTTSPRQRAWWRTCARCSARTRGSSRSCTAACSWTRSRRSRCGGGNQGCARVLCWGVAAFRPAAVLWFRKLRWRRQLCASASHQGIAG